MEKEQNERELMGIIAFLYYYQDMNQSQIADRLFLSRSTVSRLIKKARENGVIELKIKEPWERDLNTEDRLRSYFDVERVRVLKCGVNAVYEEVLTQLGQMVTYYISCTASSHSILGISWGNTVSHVSRAVSTNQNIPFTLVPIMGSMTYPEANPESLRLSQHFSRLYGSRYFPLDAPLYAENAEQLESLRADSGIAEALETARRADYILTSVGSIEGRSWKRVLGEEKLARLHEIGCVGHIGGHFFDINGHEIDGHYKELHTGLSMEELRQGRNLICVAASADKADAVYGALQGRLINSLMVTYPLALQLIELIKNRSL